MASAKKYLVLAEGKSGDEHYGKTMRGIVHYAPDPVVAILDSDRAGESYREIPIVATVDEALAYGPTTATVGVATQGGRFPPAWRELLKDSIRAGLDLESGLHEFISDDAELSGLAREHGVELRDLRKPPPELSVPTGENLQVPAKIVLTVGSDCAIGKKTVALELDLEARNRGLKSVFVPTGQTGIAIAGWGIAIDAVVADFLAGAAERLVVEGHRSAAASSSFVEGQGSLAHPAYSGVTLGLIHGSGAARVRALPQGQGDRGRGLSGPPAAEPPRAGRAPRARLAPPPGRPGSRPWRSTPANSTRTMRAPRSSGRRRRPASPRTTRSASAPVPCSTPSWRSCKTDAVSLRNDGV